MKKPLIYIFIICLLVVSGSLVTSHYYVCDQGYFQFINMTRKDLEIELTTDYDEFLWRGPIDLSPKPLVVYASIPGEKAYKIRVRDKTQRIIAEAEYGYDTNFMRAMNLFLVTNSGIDSTSWIDDGNNIFSQIWYLAKMVIGDAISCRMRRLGLSPQTIPPSLPPR